MSLVRKKLKSKRSKNIDYISSLPDEVLCMIFDCLDIKNVKNASLSCQRWNNIIFLSGYINRFGFKVRIDSYRFSTRTLEEQRNETKRQMLIKELKAVVEKTQRCYRKLYWKSSEKIEDNEFSSLWEAIHPKLTNHLHSLDLSFANLSTFLPLIADALPFMPELRSLTLKNCSPDYSTQHVISTLRSNVVKHLIMAFAIEYRVDMPQLQTFQGNLSAFNLPTETQQPVALSNLKQISTFSGHFSSRDRLYIPMLPSIFRRLTHIETMMIYDTLPNEMFSLFCEACTTLRELHINPSIAVDMNGLKKLTNLRILEIIDCNVEIDLSEVTQLEELRLFGAVMKYVKPHMSIKKLSVFIFYTNECNITQTILSSSTKLTELLVVICEEDKWYQFDPPYATLEILPRLTHLKVLKFKGGYWGRKSSFLCMDAPLDSLHELHFDGYYGSKGFHALRGKFPNLKKLTFSKYGRLRSYCDGDIDIVIESMSFSESE